MRQLLYNAFKSCCDRSPAFAPYSARGETTELVYPNNGVTFFKAHSQNVNSICVLDERNELASCSDTIKLFSTDTQQELASLTGGHEREVKCITASEQMGLLFSSSRDCSVVFWDILKDSETENAVRCKLSNLHELIITALAVNTISKQLVSGSRDSQVKLLDVQSQTCVRTSKIPRNLVTCLDWVTDSSQFVQTSEDKQLYIWDSRQLEPAHIFPRKLWIQTSCHVSSDGNLCVTSSNGFDNEGCEVTVWDLRQRNLLNEYKSHTQTVHCARFFPDSSSSFITVSNDSTVNKWNVGQAAPVSTKRPPTYSGLVSLAISVKHSQVYVGAVSGDIYVMKF